MNWLARLKNPHSLESDATKATEPSFVGFVAPVLSDCRKIKADPTAANDPKPTPIAAQDLTESDLLTGWNVTIPPGTSAATLAKFRAASLALDASIVAAGGSLAIPGSVSALTTTTVMNPRERDTQTARLGRFTDKGVSHDDAEFLADKLLSRDRESDDRRLCLECTHLSGYGRTSWRCSNWQRAGIAIRARDNQLAADLVLQLQRCDGLTHG
jgi:hypothetical protein